MFILLERYINKLSIEDINNFLIKKDIYLNNEELEFTYKFVKKNWNQILSDPNTFNINNYKDKYSIENFKKINNLVKESYIKYRKYL